MTGALAERRRRRTIERRDDTFTGCGFGRAGQHAAGEFSSPAELRRVEDLFAPLEAVAG